LVQFAPKTPGPTAPVTVPLPKFERPARLLQQNEAISFITTKKTAPGNGIFAHVVGAGKTRSAVDSADVLIHQGMAHTHVVITPAALRHNFAIEGVQRFSNHPVSIIGGAGERDTEKYDNPNPNSTYHVISYEQFREHGAEVLEKTHADTLILDEFHRVKDPD